MFTVAATSRPFEPATPADLNSYADITERVAARGIATREEEVEVSDDEADDILGSIRR